MSVHRVMGAETEYGVLAPAHPTANPAVLSTQVVTAYAALVRRRLGATGTTTGWDYHGEQPLTDARGHTLAREHARPDQLTDTAPVLTAEEIAAEALTETGLWAEDTAHRPVTNTVLPNGARLYVDHSHPEYSSPEVTTPRDALRWDAAGDRIALEAVRALAASAEDTGLPAVNLYKNNTDNKSVSYGAHENYLVPRSVPFPDLAAGLLPFFASRQVLCGAGRVGLGPRGERPGFQISQRADFFEREIGLETTVHRPLVNTRDEPHADPGHHRRLHVIIGDANLAHTSTLLKFGTTALVLGLIEAGAAPDAALADPVAALRTISHDPHLRATVPLRDGRELTGVQLQRLYLDAARAHEHAGGTPDEDTREVLDLWAEVLDALETDPLSLADRLDWVAKHALLLGYRRRDGLAWDDPRMTLVDLQYHDVRPEKSLHHRLVAAGRMRTLLDDHRIAEAADRPPEDTRAWFRGRLVARFPDAVAAANWDSVSLTLPTAPGTAPRGARITMPEPLALTRPETDALLGAATGAEDLVAALAAAHPALVRTGALG
ncbi:proteasome accessory factor PafA2 [Kocuria sp. LUK]|uniref:depupylase/deamidase Dop n=1 Tax=Kocuria sp. LUK TaxID=2897828 RepID=UPI001E28C211|nr:depupylase/deamidase Dop [Kocuria sp. LUK]MCD1143823.1 proteasome accessory factor PafA2 [Kocuria sp. LUK]